MTLLNDLQYVFPEVALTVGILLVIISGLINPKSALLTKWLATTVLIVNLVLLFITSGVANYAILFNGQVSLGPMKISGRILTALSGLLIVLVFDEKHIKRLKSEFYFFLLTLQLGSQLTIMASHAITILIAVELMSLSSYALVGFLFQKSSSEAGMKYFIYGSTATALMAFGFSWMYGATGSLAWEVNTSILGSDLKLQTLYLAGFGMVIAALCFKMAAAPFQLWAPDIYQSSPYVVITLLSNLPKLASLILLSSVITPELFNSYHWIIMVTLLSTLSLLAGNLPAIWQINARRLMGYSSIGQAGFLIMTLGLHPNQMTFTILYFGLALLLGTLLSLFCLDWFERALGAHSIDDFKGLGKKYPIPSIGLTIGFLSLTGLPPFAGFTAKFFLFTGLWSVHTEHFDLVIGLISFAVLNTAIALFYYIKIPLRLFLFGSLSESPKVQIKTIEIWWILFLASALIGLFLVPEMVSQLLGWID